MSLILSGTDGLSDIDGTAATPAIRGTDANTGIFFGADIIGFSEGGVEAARINADSQFVAAAGTAALPVITTTGDTNTGIFFPAADTIAFSEGGAEAMRIDSSGNVGIGTDSPAFTSGTGLEVQRAADATVRVERSGATASAGEFVASSGLVKIGATGGVPFTLFTDNTERMRIDSSGNVGIGTSSPSQKLHVTGGSILTDTAGSTASPSLMISSSALGTAGLYAPAANTLGVVVSATERMRIDSSGNVLVGTTSATGSSRFVVAADTTSINVMTVSNTRSTASTDYSILFYRNGNIVGSVQTTLSATSFVTSSDYRLKEDIQPMTGALAKVAQLNPVTYKWKLDGTEAQGFIAHELQAVVPDCVTGSKDELDADGKPRYQGIDTSFLVATLTAAIQEQQALITALTARITALETPSADNPPQGATP